MKHLLAIFCILSSLFSLGQLPRIVLIDKELQWRPYLTDTMTKRIIKSEEYFPLYKDELDSLLYKTEGLWNLSKMGMDRKFLDGKDFSTPNVSYHITSVSGAYGGKYDILITSKVDGKEYNFSIANPDTNQYFVQQNVRSYIENLRRAKKEIDSGKMAIKK